MLDVLLLLAVTRGLLEGLDDERRGGGDDGDGSLTILDRESDCDAETFLYCRRRQQVSDSKEKQHTQEMRELRWTRLQRIES